jgi:hypothetical protein
MQISLNIDDAIYEKLKKSGVDIQAKIDEMINSLVKERGHSKEFLENRAYFQSVLEEIESGKAKLLSQEEYEKEIDKIFNSL